MKKSLSFYLGVVLFLSLLSQFSFAGEIHYAIKKGDVKRVRELILKRPKIVEESESYNKLPLMLAIDRNQPEAVKTIIKTAREKGISLLKDPEYLARAAEKGNYDTVKFMLDKGADVNGRSFEGYTPLHFACMRNHPEIVRLLLDNNAAVNAIDYNKKTAPVHLAITGFDPRYLDVQTNNPADYLRRERNLKESHKRAQIVQMLIDRKADLSQVDFKKNTPLHLAARQNNLEAVKMLVEKGADLNVINLDGLTPLSYCLNWLVENTSCEERKIPSSETALYLVTAGSDLTVKDKNGKTPLNYAAEMGFKKVVDEILKGGEEEYQKDKRGREALAIVYILRNEPEKLKQLIGKYPELKDFENFYGDNLLFFAIRENRTDMAKFLTDLCGVKAPAGYSTPLHFAARYNRPELAAYFLDKGADPYAKSCCEQINPVEVAARYNNIDVLRVMLAKGVPADAGIETDSSPLAYAAAAGNVEVMKFLLSRGAKLHDSRYPGYSPLKHAVMSGNLKGIKFLLDAGIKKEDPKVFERILEQVMSPEAAKLLINNGAKVDDMINYWTGLNSPFDYSINTREDSYKLAKVLIENGMTVTNREEKFETALYSLISNREEELVEIVLPNVTPEYLKEYGDHLLRAAHQYKSYEIFRLLLEKGASEKTSGIQETVVFDVCDENSYDYVSLLLDRGIDVNSKDAAGETLLKRAVSNSIDYWNKETGIDVPMLLIERGAVPDLYSASALGMVDRVRKLLDKDPNAYKRPDRYGKTPFDYALMGGRDEMALFLLSKFDKNELKMPKADVLKAGMKNGCLKSIVYLIENKGSYSSVDDNGDTYLHWVAEGDNIPLAELFISKGMDVDVKNKIGQTPLFKAADKSRLKMVKYLVSKGADAGKRDQAGYSPVQMISYQIRTSYNRKADNAGNKTVFYLINSGTDVSGMTWLMAQAIVRHRADVVETLIGRGFDVNEPAPDVNIYYNRRSFHFKDKLLLNLAIEMNDMEIVKLLINAGADVNKKDKWGWTPLALAKANGYSELAELLIKNGAKE